MIMVAQGITGNIGATIPYLANVTNVFNVYTISNQSSTAANRAAINGVALTLDNTNNGANSYQTGSLTGLVGWNSNGGSMELGEMIIYDGAISISEAIQIENYLMSKWGVRNVLPQIHPFYPVQPFTRYFSPMDIDSCSLWLDGADSGAGSMSFSGTTITTWYDKSGNGNNASSYVGTPTVTAAAINGLQAVNFNGSSWFTGSITGSGTTITIFFVGSQSASINVFAGQVCLGNPSQNDYDNSGSMCISNYIGQTNIYANRDLGFQVIPIGTNSPFITCVKCDGTSANSYLNGVIQTPVNIGITGPFTFTQYAIANRSGATTSGSYAWYGYMGEVLIYTNALEDRQRQQIEGYLGWKWGIRLPGIVPTLLPGISGLTVWLDASDITTMFQNRVGTTPVTADGQVVAAWRDKSSNAYLFTQPTSGNEPIYKAAIQNGKSVTRWNGTSSLLKSSTTIPFFTSASSGGSFFVVFAATSISSQRFLLTYPNQTSGTYCVTESELGYTTGATSAGNFGFHRGCSNATVSYSQIVANQYCVMTYILGTSGTTPANSTIFKNGVSVSVGNDYSGFYSAGSYPNANNAQNVFIGARSLFGSTPDCWHYGDIAEILWYNTVVTDAQRQQIESYLSAKWAISTTAHPYYAYPPSSAVPFIPLSIQNCYIWLDAADLSSIRTNGTPTVIEWHNKGLAGASAVKNTGACKSGIYTYNNLNYISCLAGADLAITITLPNQPRAWFFVVRNKNNLGNGQYWVLIGATATYSDSVYLFNLSGSYYTEESQNSYGVPIQSQTLSNPYNLMQLYTYQNSASSPSTLNTMNVNGVPQTLSASTVATNYLTTSTTYIISSSSYTSGTDICEIIMYNGELTVKERQKVEGYLANKWGI
jgi:hypothetical protein